METTMIERVKMMEEYYHLTNNGLAGRIGVPQTTVSSYMRGRSTKIPLEFIEAILNTFEQISAEWLLRGEGNMLKDENANQSIKAENAVVGDNNHHIQQTSTSMATPKRYSAKLLYALLKGCNTDEEREQMLNELDSTTDDIKQK